MAVSTTSSQPTVKYIYQLPYTPRRNLTRILDDNNQWKELGGEHMKYDVTTLNYFGRTESPTDALLTDWSQKNHTIKDLFILLSHMQHLRAMEVLKPFVESKYHALCDNSECGLTRFLKMSLQKGSCSTGLQPANTRQPATSACCAVATNGNAGKGVVDSCNFNTPHSERSLPCKLASFPIEDNQKRPQACGDSGKSENPTVSYNRSAHPVAIPEASAPSPRQSPASSPSGVGDSNSMANILHIEEAQLAQATRNWNTASILGRGGFGTVYKGFWMSTDVAIKRMENKGLAGAEKVALQQSMGELRILNAIRHDNILPLYGYSLDGTYPCLVYEFMPKGSLEDRLQCRQGTPPLTWKQRLNIARGTARGLNFLHSRSTREKPLIHGDIKSGNILLDKAFDPKIGDFGLAREGPQTQYTHIKVSRVHGTRPYLPDEYLRGRKISTKVDTFSFGIVVYELGTGLRAYDDSRESPYLREHVENTPLSDLRDIKAGQEFIKLYEPLMTIGTQCSETTAKDRPEMKTVLEHLDQLAAEAEWHSNASIALNQNYGASPMAGGWNVNGNYPMNESFLPAFPVQGNGSRFPFAQMQFQIPFQAPFQVPFQAPLQTPFQGPFQAPFQVHDPPKSFAFRPPGQPVAEPPTAIPAIAPAASRPSASFLAQSTEQADSVPAELTSREGPDFDLLLQTDNCNLPDISIIGLGSSQQTENTFQSSSKNSSAGSLESSRSCSPDRETEEDIGRQGTTSISIDSGSSTRTETREKTISFLQN